MTELEWLDIFGDNLLSLLRETKMTRRELADEIGVSEAMISYYINKRKIPSFKILLKMAYVFNVSLDELADFGEVID
jgi:transcriptional regulator with XRE-family HTH domain